ncbi:MAG: hypothetical protein IJI46_00480 [Erysipelotrichaceae bacterium]|nr:hypothetical protein [Erysipelotrichaceae bacterium]
MYRLLWKLMNRLDIKRRHRQNLFLISCCAIYAILGAVLWFTVGDDILGKSIKWMTCFIGFPSVILGFLCGVLALFKLDQ